MGSVRGIDRAGPLPASGQKVIARLRRHLIPRLLVLSVAVFPTSARADVCGQMRPDWVPGTEATLFTEALALSMTLPSLALFLATLACFRFRLQWPSLAVVVGWTIWVSFIAFLQPGDQRALATAEGCVGPPTLFILIAGALSVGLILYTAPRDTKGPTP